MRSRLPISLWLLAGVLSSVVLWLGCEQKGEVSPTSTNQKVLAYIDTVIISPSLVAPGDNASIEARVLTEDNTPAVGEAVRFSVNRGVLGGMTADTTILTNDQGSARTQYTAPADTGATLVRTELVRMSELRTSVISVQGASQGTTGLLEVWANEDTLFADNGSSTTTVYARLRNDAHNPIGGALIYFSSTIGTITSPATTDALTGTASALLVSSSEVGVSTIIARYGSHTDTARIAFLQPSAASQIQVTSGSNRLTVGNDSTTITARVFDADNRPITDNTVVLFATDHGVLSNLSARTVGGMATTKLYAPTTTGTATVTATTGGAVHGSALVQIVPGAVAVINVLASIDTLYADNISQTNVIATVSDAYGNLVAAGVPISFSADGGTITQSSLVGDNGQAVATFTSGLEIGAVYVTASNNSVQGSHTLYLIPTEAASIALSASSLQLIADGTSTSTLRALVLDNQNRPVSDGTPITFTAEHGQLSGQGPAITKMRHGNKNPFESAMSKVGVGGKSSPRFSSATKSGFRKHLDDTQNSIFVAQTVSGYAEATLTSSTVAGVDNVSSTVNSLSDHKTISYVPGPPARIQITPDGTELPADGVSTMAVSCQVVDAFGNSLGGGVSVTASASVGTLAPASGSTNNSGIFQTTLTSARSLGLCAITATVNQATGYAQVSFVRPAVATVTLSGNSYSILADGFSFATLTAYASDIYGLPVSGENVTWNANAGIGHLIPITVVTDEAGHATATFVSGASSSDGSQSVSASIGTHNAPVTVGMRGVTINASADHQSIPADGQSTATVSVHLNETVSGVAVSGANVQFASTTGSIPQSATTNSSGIATALFQSGHTAGPVTFTCTFGDTLRASTNMVLTSTEAQTLVVSMGSNDLLANGVTSTPVSAVVYDEGGDIVRNTAVTFTSNGPGYFDPAVASTNDSGRATSSYHSAALVTDTQVPVDISITRATESRGISLRGVTMNLTTAQQVVPANGHATDQIRVELRETSSLLAISGAQVQFGTNIGTIPSTATTDASGIALVQFTAGTAEGTANVIARYGNVIIDTTQISLYIPAPTNTQVAATSQSLLGDGQSTSNVTVTVSDQQGSPLSGVQVNWSVNGSGNLTNPSSVTDGSGNATNTFTAAAELHDGTSIIEAHTGAVTGSLSIQTRGVTLLLPTSLPMIPANGRTEASVPVQLFETTSMVGLSQRTIVFGTSLGTILGQAVTDAAGRAATTIRASVNPGTANIVARYGNLLTDTTQLMMFAPVPAYIVLDPGATSLLADGVSTTLMRVWVSDAQHVALSGAQVSWSASGALLSQVTTMTDDSGMTSVVFRSNASQSDINAVITATSGDAQTSANIQERGVTIEVTPIPALVIADGTSTTQIHIHLSETSSHVGINQASITLATDLGTIPNSAATDASGLATQTLTSSTQTGTAHVTASFGNVLSANTQVTFAQSTPTTLSLTASPTILVADNVSTSTLTAVVTDQSGNPVPNGTQIQFSLPPQSGSLENLRTTQGGVAINTLTSSSTPDTVTVVAYAPSNPTARDSVTVIYRVGAPAVVTLSSQRDTLRADGIQVDTVTAHVTDAVGHALQNVDVHFTTTIGNITASRVTDMNGNSRVAFSSAQTGTAVVTANASGATGTYTVYLVPGSPNSIQMSYAPTSVGVRGSGRNETLLINATVRDANNNPVLDGTPVTFNINNSPGGGDFLSSTGPIPSINGSASVSYNSGTVSGSVRIRAICESVSAVSTEILIYAGPPYIENIADGCSASHMSIGANPCNMFGMDVVGDSVQLVALVGDRYNNPVTPGTAVYFTTSGGVITTGTGYTDSLGFARVTLYGGNPLPTVNRWLNTIHDPNIGGAILCGQTPTEPGVAKVMASAAGVDANGDSVIVWATTNVTFDYSQPYLYIREASVNGDENQSTLYIGQTAYIRIALYDADFWPMVAGTQVNFSASKGLVYPPSITIGCPGDTSYAITYFNNLTLQDDDAASPVLIQVDSRRAGAFTFTRTFTLRASLPPSQ